jgi:hypothetical protein
MASEVGPMKMMPGLGAFAREGVVLGGKTPAGMDGHNAPALGHGDDLVDIQICARILGPRCSSSWAAEGKGAVLSTSVAVIMATASKRSRMDRQIRRAGIPRLATRIGLFFSSATTRSNVLMPIFHLVE